MYKGVYRERIMRQLEGEIQKQWSCRLVVRLNNINRSVSEGVLK